MITSVSVSRPVRRFLRMASLAVLCFGLTHLAAAEAVKRNFDLPAGDASATLKTFAQQSGEQIVYPVEQVRGVKTNAVKGELAARIALERMLDKTGLAVVQDEKTGALSVTRAVDPNGPRAAPTDSDRPDRNTKVEGGKVVLETVQVTGSRLRGLLAGANSQPVLTLDREDIERTGAMSIGDVLRYIPQVSASTTGQGNTQATPTSVINLVTFTVTPAAASSQLDGNAGRVTATIRGAPSGATLLLIDGKRAPKNNQANGGDGYDLSGIPLAAVERIEVLLDGASSIYGADAMGGVINVILKKNYSGTEVRLGYDNTFDTDSGIMTGSFSHGFAVGKLRGLITASWEKANALALRDRWFTASYDRRPFGGGDYRSTIPGGAGRISISGAVPLPGLTVTSVALSPGNAGTNLTVTDYANAGAIAAPMDFGQYMDYAASYQRNALLAKFDYEFRDWLEISVQARSSRNRNTAPTAPISASGLSIPAGYPGNPFGVAVTLNKWFFDLVPERVSIDDTQAFSIGASGRLPGNWRYDASLSRANSRLQSNGDSGVTIVSALFNAAVAAGRTPNLFYDGTRVANPNAAGVIEALTTPTLTEEKDETWTYSLQADGPVYSLPAGSISTAFGVERREEYADFPLRLATDTSSARSGSDKINAYFGEVNIPIFSQLYHAPLLRQLNLSGSYRYEEYQSGGSAKNPRGGVAWRPFQWLLVRGSYGEGFKVPTLAQLTAPTRVVNSSTVGTTSNLDPLRGNTVNAIYPVTLGGKPDLLPERSENTTAGFVAEVPFIKGLSLSFDWFDNKFNDRIGSLTFNQLALLYPSRITRGPNLPTDLAGWAGPVTAVDLRPINVSYSRTTGYDIGLKYDRRNPWGDVQVALSGTKYTRNVLVPSPDTGPSSTVNTDSLPVQINGNAFFYRQGWGAGVLTTYRAAGRAATDRIVTPSAIRWDVQGNYDFAKSAWAKAHAASWYGRALKNTRVSVTIFKVLNTVPPFDYIYFPDNSVLDTRLRHFSLSVIKQF
jgi:outer membrane receptor protein involved in Fe transport